MAAPDSRLIQLNEQTFIHPAGALTIEIGPTFAYVHSGGAATKVPRPSAYWSNLVSAYPALEALNADRAL